MIIKPDGPYEIMARMEETNDKLSMKIDELSDLVQNMANAEREYNMAYARKLLTLKSEGCAVTTAKELAKGDKFVADQLFQFRVSEGVYDACKKKIASLNTSIDTDRSFLSWRKQEYSQNA